MTRFLAVLSGMLLLAAVGLLEPWAALPALGLVIAGWWWRPAAVGAVLLVVGVLAFADAGVVAAAATGLSATAYLLAAANVSAPDGVVPATVPSVGAAVLFTVAAGTAAVLPIELAWAPLVAPVAIIVLYALLIGASAQQTAADAESANTSSP